MFKRFMEFFICIPLSILAWIAFFYWVTLVTEASEQPHQPDVNCICKGR